MKQRKLQRRSRHIPNSTPVQAAQTAQPLLELQKTIGNQATLQLMQANQHIHGCGCGACVPQVQSNTQAQRSMLAQRGKIKKKPPKTVPSSTPLSSAIKKPKINKDKLECFNSYKAAYYEAYEAGFWEGFDDALKELISDNVIDSSQAGSIKSSHTVTVERGEPYKKGWRDGVREDPSFEDPDFFADEGRSAGEGAGFDDGYYIALTQYGYSRKYSAIPSGNKSVAMADNGGTCVYCNAAPTADVDHIEPLKVHWSTRGAVMGQGARSAEANDTKNLVGACAACNRSKGAKRLDPSSWWPPAWGGTWWPFGPVRVKAHNTPPPYW